MASKYEKDTGRQLKVPKTLGGIFDDPSIQGNDLPCIEIDKHFEDNLKKGVIDATSLKRSMTFFEAVEYLRLPMGGDGGAGKNGAAKKVPAMVPGLKDHHMLTKIDLSGFNRFKVPIEKD